MRSTKFGLSRKPTKAWDGAVVLVEAYFSAGMKADQVLELLPPEYLGQARASCQSLFLGALRHGHRTRAACSGMLRKQPRPIVEALLMVAGFELQTEPPNKHPKIVHHAVECSKALVRKHEQSFLNAVLRKLPAALHSIDEAAAPADFYSHPRWLVDHWVQAFGLGETLDLLRWNQGIPQKTIRLYSMGESLPEFLRPSEWPGFFRISNSADWQADVKPLLAGGDAYIKDPSTRIAPALLRPAPGAKVLDLCAAPGGKSFDLAHLMKFSGRIIAVDLPGQRSARLRENLSRLVEAGMDCRLLERDLLTLGTETFREAGLPMEYDAVMLDAPCSNTGVIQRRTDVKWRLKPEDLEQCASLQKELLAIAAGFLKPGGRLVYSTCSIEKQENADVVNAFLGSERGRGFRRGESKTSLPWKEKHDGAGAFLLLREN